MPSSVIKSFASKSNKSIDYIENKWNELKKEYGDDYKSIVGTLKKILKIEEATFSGDFAKVLPPLMNTGKRILPFADFLKMKDNITKKKKKKIKEISFREFVYNKVKDDLKEMFNVNIIEAEVNGVKGYTMEFDDNTNLDEVKEKISNYFKSKGLKITNFLRMEN